MGAAEPSSWCGSYRLFWFLLIALLLFRGYVRKGVRLEVILQVERTTTRKEKEKKNKTKMNHHRAL